MLKKINSKGFASILEVIVSSVIFMITAFGFFSSVSMLRPQGTESARKLEAAYIGKQVIDNLRAKVYGNLWLDAGSPLLPGTTYTQTIGIFAVNYYTEDVAGMPLRRLVMNIQYPDI